MKTPYNFTELGKNEIRKFFKRYDKNYADSDLSDKNFRFWEEMTNKISQREVGLFEIELKPFETATGTPENLSLNDEIYFLYDDAENEK